MKFLKRGITDSFQDYGRPLAALEGIPVSGAMDIKAIDILKLLFDYNNSPVAIEMAWPAPVILFEEDTQMALSGADFDAHLNAKPLVLNKVYSLKSGDILSFKRKISGNYTYLALSSHFKLNGFYESYSTYPPLSINILQENIELFPSLKSVKIKSGIQYKSCDEIIKIVLSEAYEQQSSLIELLNQNSFEISPDSSRMAYKLILKNKLLIKETLQASIFIRPGSIQILPSGDLIVLMPDAQVSGGYPILGYLSALELSKLAQLAIGKKHVIKIENEVHISYQNKEWQSYIFHLKTLRHYKLWT
jgi:allophanate hydrolase subunit 2